MTIKDNKGAGARKQKKSIKPTAAEFEKLGKNPSPQAVMKLFSRSYRILNDVELQNADYPPMLFAQFDDGAATPDELPGPQASSAAVRTIPSRSTGRRDRSRICRVC